MPGTWQLDSVLMYVFHIYQVYHLTLLNTFAQK